MRNLPLVILTCLLSTAAVQDDAKIDNPEFLAWKDRKPGATVRHKGTMEMKGAPGAIETENTNTLIEVKADAVIVEMATSMKMQGMKMPGGKPVKRTVEAKISPKDFTGGAVKGKFEKSGEGDEELEIGGKKYACHWYAFAGEPDEQGPGAPKGKYAIKSWMCKDVPGGLVRFSMTSEDKATKIFQELVDFKLE